MAILTAEEEASAEPLKADRACWFVNRSGDDGTLLELGCDGVANARMLFVPLPARYRVVRRPTKPGTAPEPASPEAGKSYYLSTATFNDAHMLIEGKKHS